MSINISRLQEAADGREESITHLLDFMRLPCSHSGFNMATFLSKVLKEYGIEYKVSQAIVALLKNELTHTRT